MRQRFLALLDTKGISALELRTSLKLLASPIDLVFFMTAHLPLDPYVKQQILEQPKVEAQIEQLLEILGSSLGSQLN
jgi:hypothetical protein